MEQLWSEHSHRRAVARLEDVASHLRTLLRPPESHAKLLTHLPGSSGSGYLLIWVDADAFVWHVEQAARMERFGTNVSYLAPHYQ